VILVDQPFRIGDRIKLQSGEEGDVYQIGLRSTRILNLDHNIVVIPNGELVKNRIINYSFPDSNIRIIVEVGIAYGTNIEKAKRLLFKLAQQHSDISKDPSPEVFLMNFGDSAIQLRLVARTSHFEKKLEVETALREQIYKTFEQEGIEIPLPQRVVTLVNSNAAQASQKK